MDGWMADGGRAATQAALFDFPGVLRELLHPVPGKDETGHRAALQGKVFADQLLRLAVALRGTLVRAVFGRDLQSALQLLPPEHGN